VRRRGKGRKETEGRRKPPVEKRTSLDVAGIIEERFAGDSTFGDGAGESTEDTGG
jgi:hypothetical protein